MNRLTPVWTDVHTRMVLIWIHAAIGTAVAAHGQDLLFTLITAGLFMLAVTVGLAFDWLLVLATGFACAAALFFLKPAAGAGDVPVFVSGTLEVFFLISAGMAAHFAGDRVRTAAAEASAGAPDVAAAPTHGSLGLAGADLGEIRLEEEIERARRYRRPLSVARVAIDYRPGIALTQDEQAGIARAIARLFETMLRGTDAVYAYGRDSIVAVLPETNAEGAWIFLSRITGMSADATFMVRSEAERRAVRDYATPHFAVVSFPEDGDSAQELLDASEELIRVYREDRSRFFPGRHEAPPAAPHHAPYLPDAAEHAAALAADSLRRAKENDEGPDDRPGGTNRLQERSKDDVSRSR